MRRPGGGRSRSRSHQPKPVRYHLPHLGILSGARELERAEPVGVVAAGLQDGLFQARARRSRRLAGLGVHCEWRGGVSGGAVYCCRLSPPQPPAEARTHFWRLGSPPGRRRGRARAAGGGGGEGASRCGRGREAGGAQQPQSASPPALPRCAPRPLAQRCRLRPPALPRARAAGPAVRRVSI